MQSMEMSGSVSTNKAEGHWEAQRGSFVGETERDPNYDTLRGTGSAKKIIHLLQWQLSVRF